MKIARVFPTKTSMSPTDKDCYFDFPDMFTPKYDEVHISCTFTWDKKRANELAYAWQDFGKVRIGGVAIDGESDQPFVAGMYLKKGITITSRGCPNKCSFCLVRKNLIEFDEFPEGNIIQDNNFLMCSKRHRELVYEMLKKQSGIQFKGGLQASLITPEIADELRALRIKELWFACDTDNHIEGLRKAIEILKQHGFYESHFYCYVLIGKEEQRLREVRSMGVMPFAQLYMKPEDKKTSYTKEMKQYQRIMCKPAITRNIFTPKGD